MNDKHKVIEPDKLEVGMNVAYPYFVSIGWHKEFRYPKWREAFVKRVTPKRTKAVLTKKDGTIIEVNLRSSFVYELDADMERENECVNMYEVCRKIITTYDLGRWKAFYELSDDELKEVYVHLTALDEIMRKENR